MSRSSEKGFAIAAALTMIGILGSITLVLSSMAHTQESQLAQADSGAEWVPAALKGRQVQPTVPQKSVADQPQQCTPGTDFFVWTEESSGKVQKTPDKREECFTTSGTVLNTPACQACKVFYCTKRRPEENAAAAALSTARPDPFSPMKEMSECQTWTEMLELYKGKQFTTANLQKGVTDLASDILGQKEKEGKEIDVALNDLGCTGTLADAFSDPNPDCQELARQKESLDKEKSSISRITKENVDAVEKIADKNVTEAPKVQTGPQGGLTGGGVLSGADCVTSFSPVEIIPGKYGPGCLNYKGGGNNTNGYQTPSTFSNVNAFACTISASPSQVQRNQTQQTNTPVQLQWYTTGGTTQNPPYRAVIYGVGTMGPSGSISVYPQQTTEYTMTAYGYTEGTAQCKTTVTVQNQNPYGTGSDGRACQQSPQQPPTSQCSSGTWKPVSATGNGCVTGYQCVPTAVSAPTAELRCEPQAVDVGMTAGIVWGCGNSTWSSGTGFETSGIPSGTALVTISSTTSPATYSIACGNAIATTSAACALSIKKPEILFVANPSSVSSGEYANLAWVTTTGGMQSCRVSSPDHASFTTEHAQDTAVSGVVRTPSLSATSRFVVTCVTHGGALQTASTTVVVN